MVRFGKGWWTVLYGMLIAALGSLQAADLVEVVATEYVGMVLAVIGAVIIGLRAITDSAIGSD